MYTIKEDLENIKILKKSKFIAKVFFIKNQKEANTIINNTRLEYKEATHICYCYICNNTIKFSDDKEPNNTAGIPIYNVLKKSNLNYVLAIVIRYFGGIKLGSGGLIRTYSNCISELVNNNIIPIENSYLVDINFKYHNIKNVNQILNKYNIINKKYLTLINYKFEISKKEFKYINDKLKRYIENISIIKESIIR